MSLREDRWRIDRPPTRRWPEARRGHAGSLSRPGRHASRGRGVGYLAFCRPACWLPRPISTMWPRTEASAFLALAVSRASRSCSAACSWCRGLARGRLLAPGLGLELALDRWPGRRIRVPGGLRHVLRQRIGELEFPDRQPWIAPSRSCLITVPCNHPSILGQGRRLETRADLKGIRGTPRIRIARCARAKTPSRSRSPGRRGGHHFVCGVRSRQGNQTPEPTVSKVFSAVPASSASISRSSLLSVLDRQTAQATSRMPMTPTTP